MKSVLALSALASSAMAQYTTSLAADWATANVDFGGAEANWENVQTVSWLSDPTVSVQLSPIGTETVSTSTGNVDVTWFTYQELDGELMIWIALEVTGDESGSNDDLNVVSIGASGYDETVCSWTYSKSNGKIWYNPTVTDYWQGASDVGDDAQQSVAQDQSYYDEVTSGTWWMGCVFTRPTGNDADPTQDSDVLSSSDFTVTFAHPDGLSTGSTGYISGEVIDLGYVTPPPVEDVTDVEEEAEELEEDLEESSMMISASLATIAVATILA